MKKFLWVSFVTVLLFLGTASVRADDTELFTIRVSPDALILLDLSGSMSSPPQGEWLWGDASCNLPYYGSSGAGHTNPCYAVKDLGNPNNNVFWVNPATDASCNGPFYTKDATHTKDCSKLTAAKQAIFDILDDNNDGKIDSSDETSLAIRMGYMRFWDCYSMLPYSGSTASQLNPTVDYTKDCIQLKREFYPDGSSTHKTYEYKNLNDLITAETVAGSTPLEMIIREGVQYLDANKVLDPSKECRKKFMILITDGYDTLACGGRRSVNQWDSGSYDYMRRRATLAAVKGAVDAGYQVFVIGFGADMPQQDKYTLQWAAFKGGTDNPAIANSGDTSAITFSSDPCATYASCTADPGKICTDPPKNGTVDPGCKQTNCNNAPNDPGYKPLNGYAFLAQDSATLGTSLKSIFRTILERAFSFTAPSIPVVRLLNDDVLYISSFTPNEMATWRGDVKAYELKADGTVDVDANGYPIDPKWSAMEKLDLRDPSTRQIYTYVGGSLKEFTSANISKTDLGVATDADRDALINHIRGIDNYDTDQDLNTTEWRKYKLGDIYHSNAVIVGPPNVNFQDEGFNGAGGFYELNKNRTKTLIVGANDGMLHVFDADRDSGGGELRAFIPPSALPNLKGIKTDWDQYKATGQFPASSHRYFVDGTPKVSDVWLYSSDDDTTKEPSEWRTVLVSGLRKGGNTYFALDVTDAANSLTYLWQFPAPGDATTLDLMGQTWSEPAVGRVKITVGGKDVERWVAFIGGGYTPDDSKGRCFFVIDIKTGAILKQFSGLTGMTKSIAAPPKAVDLDANGYIDKVYVGDLGGQMWIFNVSSKDTASWTGKRLFVAQGWIAGKHPIFYEPSVALDVKRIPWIYFGTGDREAPRDTNARERFYAVKDDDPAGYYQESNLKDVSCNNTFVPPTTEKGWFINLGKNCGVGSDKAEKVMARAQVFNHLVFFTTYSPVEDPEPCTVGGTPKLYIVDYLSGGGALSVDELSDLSGTAGDRWKVVGGGMASDPVITIKNGQASIIIGVSSGTVFSQLAPIQPNPSKILYWREVIN